MIILSSAPVLLKGQNADSTSLQSVTHRLDSIAVAYLKKKIIERYNGDLQTVRHLFSIKTDRSEGAARIEVLQARQAVLRGDIGLEAGAGYLQNFKAGFFGVAGIFYQRRVQAGLSWNILNNGLLENRYKLEQLQLKERLIKERMNRQLPTQYIQLMRHRIRRVFIQKKMKILQTYLQLLNRREKVAIRMYHKNYRTWDEVLQITSQRARIAQLAESLKSLNNQSKPDQPFEVQVRDLPALDINLGFLIQTVKYQNRKIVRIYNRAITAYHPLTDISLALSAGYNYYSSAPAEALTGLNDRHEYISASVSVSIPIPLQAAEKENLAEAKFRLFKTKRIKKRGEKLNRSYELYADYQQVLSEYKRDLVNYRRIGQKIRNIMVKKRLGSPAYSPVKLLSLLSKRYDKALEVIDNLQQMYKKFIEIYALSHSASLMQLTEEVDIEINKTVHQMPPDYSKNIYIWSSTFERYKNEVLIEYLKEQKFTTVFLSGGAEPNWEKAGTFIEMAYKKDIRVQWMVGNNQLIFEDHVQKLRNEIEAAAKIDAGGIHLDVEPQTFEDWEHRKKYYKNLYLKMVRRASKVAEKYNLELSLSVPVYFDSIIEKLSHYAGSIHLMAYGTNEFQEILERTAQERKVAKEKVAIALRPVDFRNYEAFSSILDKLRKKLILNRFSIHDLKVLLQIQQKAFGNK